MDLNIIAPYLIGGIVTLGTGWIGAYLAYRGQRPKSLAEAQNIAEEADAKVFARMEASASRLEREINDLRTRLELSERKHEAEAAAWAKEREVLTHQYNEAIAKIAQLTLELSESQEVLTIVRDNGERQTREIESLRGRIRDLEAENNRLKSGSREKL